MDEGALRVPGIAIRRDSEQVILITYPITQNLAFRVILKVPVPFEAALNELAELLGKCFLIEQVMDTKT